MFNGRYIFGASAAFAIGFAVAVFGSPALLGSGDDAAALRAANYKNSTAPISFASTDTHAFMRVTQQHRDAARFLKAEHTCMAQAIYHEARSETRSGQIAVAEVVQNRVKSKHFPNSICGVIYQGSGRKSGCQFSFMCDGSVRAKPRAKSWGKAVEMAKFVQTHDIAPITRGATHYHTTAINPTWSTDLRFTRNIGSHKFYRFRFKERPVASAPSLSIAPPI